MSLPWWMQSAQRLASLIRSKEVSSRDVVAAHIAHIESVNPVLNAVVATRFEQAMDEAVQADKALAQNPLDALPPLLGVPCTIKECFALTGMPQTAGLVARQGTVATSDATVVSRLRKAGAIPLGSTNTSELCMWMESFNRVYGRTNNPYDPRRTVGGSSGGEGAIIGAGGSPFGVGSDLGGSIRMPAFFNGVFGHKPSAGLIPNSGQFPIPDDATSLRYVTTGPLCRKAEDLMPLLRVMAGPDGVDVGAQEYTLGDPAEVSLCGLPVLQVFENGRYEVSPELLVAQSKAGLFLESEGASIRQQRFPRLERSLEIWSLSLAAAGEPYQFRRLIQRESLPEIVGQLLLWCLRLSGHTLPALMLALGEGADGLFPETRDKFVAEGALLRDELLEAIGPDGVMLFPSYVQVAPRHYQALMPPFCWIYTAIINILGFPATQVPLGLNAEGLPLGVQVIAAPGQDHRTIAVAQALEGAFGGWQAPKVGILEESA